jgi:aspartate kinase
MVIKVFKFGGTSLEGKERILNAVSACIEEVDGGSKIICVVSAMGKTTEDLYALVQQIHPRVTVEESMPVVGMGEIISARILSYALRKKHVSVKLLEPFAREWPILLKRDGSLSKRRTKKAVEECMPALLKTNDVVIVPGFIGVKPDGSWGTLGRGGSDTTAFIFGKYVDADEIVMVKDVDGVYTADPSLVPGAEHLTYIDADELSTLSAFGAGVMHADALSYKGKNQKVRIVHHDFGNLAYGGTVVDGTVERKLYLLDEKLNLISFYKRDIAGERDMIEKLSSKIIQKTKVFGTTLGIDYLGFYVPSSESKSVIKACAKSATKRKIKLVERKDIALLIMRRESPVNLPGMITYLLTPLSRKQINVVEVITIGREILVFTNWSDREKAMDILKKSRRKKN